MQSEVLVDWQTVQVIRWTFEPGEGLSAHRARAPALMLCLRGRIRVVLNGAPHLLHAEDRLAMAAGDEHSLVSEEPSAMLLVLAGNAGGRASAASAVTGPAPETDGSLP